MAPDLSTDGIHHVTAVAGDPQRNADFYVGTLGLRFVKRTVNHDDRHTYHLYFADDAGTPGTSVTFFPWGEDARRGRVGTGQVTTTAFRVPADSLDWWADRLADAGVAVTREERFDETALAFEDPDGIGLELVGVEDPAGTETWADSPVPAEHQVRGFFGVTLSLADADPTADLLTGTLGFEPVGEAAGRRRLRAGPAEVGDLGAVVDLTEPGDPRGAGGVGTVHHVAVRATDVEEQADWRAAVREAGLSPTEVIDRKYFRSIYFRERGGVLVEIATDGPGFTADEDRERLGESLVLPDFLEDEREAIEARLPDLSDPRRTVGPDA